LLKWIDMSYVWQLREGAWTEESDKHRGRGQEERQTERQTERAKRGNNWCFFPWGNIVEGRNAELSRSERRRRIIHCLSLKITKTVGRVLLHLSQRLSPTIPTIPFDTFFRKSSKGLKPIPPVCCRPPEHGSARFLMKIKLRRSSYGSKSILFLKKKLF
jgi:hypothetical protein